MILLIKTPVFLSISFACFRDKPAINILGILEGLINPISLISKTKKGVGVIPVLPIKNSIREIKNNTSKNIDRKNLFIVQTPQSFLSNDIKKAYNQEFKEAFTDDASVFENNGWKIISILGEESNIKITTKNDFKIAQLLMQ